MPPSHSDSLLPGVCRSEPELHGYSGSSEIKSARVRANFRDIFDLLLLLGVDVFFFNWPWMHVPFLTQSQSVVLITIANVWIVAFCALSRSFPYWRARRIAQTWCDSERKKFAVAGPSRG